MLRKHASARKQKKGTKSTGTAEVIYTAPTASAVAENAESAVDHETMLLVGGDDITCKVSEEESKRHGRKRRTVDRKRNDRKKRKKESDQSEDKVVSHDQMGVANYVAEDVAYTPGPEMSEWVELGVPHPLLRALHELKFYHPTEIQKMILPLVVKDDDDIIGAAETVSKRLHATIFKDGKGRGRGSKREKERERERERQTQCTQCFRFVNM